jgi:hypothetical protein
VLSGAMPFVQQGAIHGCKTPPHATMNSRERGSSKLQFFIHALLNFYYTSVLHITGLHLLNKIIYIFQYIILITTIARMALGLQRLF